MPASEGAKARRRQREILKKRRARARRKAVIAAARIAAMHALGVSKTSPEYRRQLPPTAPLATPRERLAFLAAAVRNTAGARV